MRDRVRLALAAHRPLELPLASRRAAAVLLLLHEERGVEHVLFQVRTLAVDHPGEISFPGGGHHPSDRSLLATALRETREEIGVPAHDVEVLGQLDDTATRSSNYLIRPYVGVLRPGPREFATAPLEVSELLRVPLDHLLSPGTRGWYVVDDAGAPEPTAAYYYGEHVIWGATARMLDQLLSLIDAGSIAGTIEAGAR
ncbi:MAG: CoA pyrophosphatase [Dehalococcoidia bacterium]|nr:CoA pyrophosphatase [Dehalococcoidia bacterium]